MSADRRKLASLAFWEALEARYPLGSRWELARPAGAVIAANFLTARALVRGEMRPWELVILVALEAAALSAIAWVQNFSVPPEARADHDEKKTPIAQRLGALAFGLVWLIFVYGLIFFAYLRETPDWGAVVRDPIGFLASSAIRWPLAVSVGGALLDAIADRQFWRLRGGTFISTPGFTAIARWLTLIFGGIPFFVPFAAGAAVIAAVAKGIERRIGPRPRAHGAIAAIPVLGIALFAGVGWLIRAGSLGWTIGYVSAKLLAELLLLGIPLLAGRAAREEREALAPSPSSRPAAAKGKARRRGS
jgi:hypothetical protein